MAQLPGSFNAGDHDDMMSFSAFNSKNTPVKIIKSEMVETNAKDGHYAKLEFLVLAGKHKGSHLWTQLNVDNPSEKAVEIAQRELATICRAVGKVAIDDTTELHGIPMLVDTEVESSEGYKPKTKIVMYKPYDDDAAIDTGGDDDSKAEEDKPKKSGKKKPWD